MRPASAPPAGAVLDAVCRSVAQLAGAAPHPPRRIRMQDGQTTVEVEWPDPVHTALAPADDSPTADRESGAPESGQPDLLTYIRAPMVGTFYHASTPDAQPYVSVGDVVQPGQPVGVLEAMKMMSAITADTGGRVVEMVAPNAHPVEFDQQLIALEPVDVDTVDHS
ncbi:acetyl-CoA carboxylase biotin carboxyl carrier protein [Streptacidiphilus sp. MAP12-16]|uniref:acetyl-CoA carboxylase biotin carboxyl carrier protein n=1 Tax=Streptacidiphilus sp. MAP12-16 TaxID=3156300 RepID=UPI003516E2BB